MQQILKLMGKTVDREAKRLKKVKQDMEAEVEVKRGEVSDLNNRMSLVNHRKQEAVKERADSSRELAEIKKAFKQYEIILDFLRNVRFQDFFFIKA